MSFARQISRVPLPFHPSRGADTLAALPNISGAMRDLVEGAAGCSPYLALLLTKQADWILPALDDPDAALTAELDGLNPGGSTETAAALRVAKQRVALLAALADLGGVWDLGKVTGALTQLADRALDTALKTALLPHLTRGKLPGHTDEALDDCGGLLALAMGKMGAHELNYSSDIDIICLFDDQRFDATDLGTARAVFIKTVRKAAQLLQDNTADGYVFRTDLRLRPDPSVTPVALSISAAERYYEALGRTWERAAYVKARPCAGDIPAGERFLTAIRPFIWRRHLDFTTVQDAHDIRQKIREHKVPTAGKGLDGHNVKLGLGGIREIEFFTQTRQLIAGGRDPSLRVKGTQAALSRLAETGWVDGGDARRLEVDYIRLREIEHRLQMVQDAQTHVLPGSSEEWSRLAMFTGTTDVEDLKAELARTFDRVHRLTEGFFAPQPAEGAGEISEDEQQTLDRWNTYPALRSDRARKLFDSLGPKLIAGFDRAARPTEALTQFEGFLKGLPAGVQLFSLFEANPQLIDLMVDIASTAPALALYLSTNSGVFDAVIGGDFFAPWPGAEALEAELASRLSDPSLDFERQLDTARHWMKDWHFRVGVHFLRNLVPPAEAAVQYTHIAQATVSGLWQVTRQEFARKHGNLPGRGAVVLGMGSLGARQLTARSDLDLIVIYDAPADAESDGRRPLPTRTYFARLTKALVTALSTPTAAGTLYEVDMRLRPSGRQGPAATSWTAFQDYQENEAWTWEHLALTRARPVAGDTALAQDFENFRQELLSKPRVSKTIYTDLSDMRDRLGQAKPQSGIWDVNNGPGGLQDIELLAQTEALLSGSREVEVNAQLACPDAALSEPQQVGLRDNHALFATVKSVAKFLSDQPLDPAKLGHGGRQMLLRETGHDEIETLGVALERARSEAAAILDIVIDAGKGNS